MAFSLNSDSITQQCDLGIHERCNDVECECFCHKQKVPEPDIDDSVLEDAARQLESAARRLKKAVASKHYPSDRKKLIGEARALVNAAEARIK